MRQWANSKIHRYCIRGGKCGAAAEAAAMAADKEAAMTVPTLCKPKPNRGR